MDAGEVERAIELYALACRLPMVEKSQWHQDVVGRHIAAAGDTLPPQVVEDAQVRGRALDLWRTVDELLEEFTPSLRRPILIARHDVEPADKSQHPAQIAMFRALGGMYVLNAAAPVWAGSRPRLPEADDEGADGGNWGWFGRVNCS